MANAKKTRNAKLSAKQRIRPEAELEALLTPALKAAFPNIARSDFHHQTRFTVQLGHEVEEYDAAWAWKMVGRADILIFHNDRPLAVVELKREDKALTEADRKQAQGYANQITPRPPLVILTNGKEVRVFDSSNGAVWSPGNDAQATVAKLLENAATVAAAGVRWAIEALMGPEAGIWTKAVRARTQHLIDQLTGEPAEARKPFVADFLIPRFATLALESALKSDATVVLIEGAPVSGKTTVLRELALRTAQSPDLAVLMVRGAAGPGLFQRIANLFSAELEWEVSADNIRQWLRRLSSIGYGPTLVLAIDGLSAGSAMATDVEELAESGFGPRLKIVATTDEAEAVLNGANGRSPTALSGLARRLEVSPLNHREFQAAQQGLDDLRIQFMRGAHFAEDFRAPWLLRAIYAKVAADPKYAQGNLAVMLPASLGVGLVDETRQAFAGQTELLRGYRLIARDALADTERHSPELRLEASHAFVVRRDALSDESRAALPQLAAQGWVTLYRHAGGEDVIALTAPELFLSEMAEATAAELAGRTEADPREAGIWLGERLDAVYLGDLIGAQAIRDLAKTTQTFSGGLIEGLMSIEPESQPVSDALVAMAAPDGSLQHLRIQNGKAKLSNRAGETYGPEVEMPPEVSQMFSQMTGWMILGQFAHLPTATMLDNDEVRMDASILLHIGTCKFPLLRASRDVGHVEHDLGEKGQVLCPDNGAIEATTSAIADLLTRPWDHRDAWIDRAIETDSMPMLYRLLIALRTVRDRSKPEVAAWARETLKTRVEPAIDRLMEDNPVLA